MDNWVNESRAKELLAGGARKQSQVIHTRRQEIQRNLDAYVSLIWRQFEGYDVLPEIRSTYRNMQLFARMLGDLAIGARKAHADRGTLLPALSCRVGPQPETPEVADAPGFLPLVKPRRWMAEPRAEGNQSP